ncbi:MAG: cytochrome c3 family protein [Candidatus Methanofastidiosia archaeon]
MRWFLIALMIWSVVLFPMESQTPNSCYNCHKAQSGSLGRVAEDWEKSIHKEGDVFCSDCHGGNPMLLSLEAHSAKNFIGVPSKSDIPELCGGCHSNEKKMRQYGLDTQSLSQYRESVHGIRLLEFGDEDVAQCASCHNAHEVKSSKDPQSSTYKTNVPKTCAKCHSDSLLMERYNLPSDQHSKFKNSVHGKALLEMKDTRAPNCADCHGVHGASPPVGSEIKNVCGQCHSATRKNFEEGAHYKALKEKSSPDCSNCHEHHGMQAPTLAMFEGSDEGHCGECHSKDSIAYKEGLRIKKTIEEAEDLVSEAKKYIKEAESEGIEVSDQLVRLDETKTDLVLVEVTQHSVNFEKVQEHTKKIEERASSVISEVEKLVQQKKARMKVLYVTAFLIFVLVLLMALKRKSL